MYAQVCVGACTQVDWRSPGSVGNIPGAVKRSSWYTDGPPSRSHSPPRLQLPTDRCSHFLQKRGSANSLVEAVSNNSITTLFTGTGRAGSMHSKPSANDPQCKTSSTSQKNFVQYLVSCSDFKIPLYFVHL